MTFHENFGFKKIIPITFYILQAKLLRLEEELKEKEGLLAKSQPVHATSQTVTPDLGKQEQKCESENKEAPPEGPTMRIGSQLEKPKNVTRVVNQHEEKQGQKESSQIPRSKEDSQPLKPQNIALSVDEQEKCQDRKESHDEENFNSDTSSEPKAPVPGDNSSPSGKAESKITHESRNISSLKNQGPKRTLIKKEAAVADIPKSLQRVLESIKKELLKRNPANPLQVIQTVLLGLASDLGAIEPQNFNDTMSGLGLPVEDGHTDLIFENFVREGTEGLDISSFLSTLDQLKPVRDLPQKVPEESRKASGRLKLSPEKEAQAPGPKEKTKRPQSSRAASTDRESKPKRASSSMGNHDRLPEKWERLVTPQGRYYYVDHSNRKTQWEHPVTGKKSQVVADAWTEKHGH